MNKVFLIGRLTRDPELRYTQSGKAYMRTAVAVTRPFSKDNAVDFFNLLAWEKTAEFIAKYFGKGVRIAIEGRLQTSTYDKDGAKVTSYEVLIENVEFADGKKDDVKTAENKPAAKSNHDDYWSSEPVDPNDTPF